MNAPIENRDQSLEHPTNEGSSSNVFINEIARRPRSVSETGLSSNLLAGLLVKHLYDGGPMTINHLSVRTALAGPILEELLNTLRTDAYVEIRASRPDTPGPAAQSLCRMSRADGPECGRLCRETRGVRDNAGSRARCQKSAR